MTRMAASMIGFRTVNIIHVIGVAFLVTLTNTLISIYLAGFNLSGRFPFRFCQIQTLQNLSLVNNTLNGKITSRAFSRCSHLHFLSLVNNYFSGKLPNFSPEFTNLENLDLSDNFFTGKIPVSFGRRFPVLRVYT